MISAMVYMIQNYFNTVFDKDDLYQERYLMKETNRAKEYVCTEHEANIKKIGAGLISLSLICIFSFASYI